MKMFAACFGLLVALCVSSVADAGIIRRRDGGIRGGRIVQGVGVLGSRVGHGIGNAVKWIGCSNRRNRSAGSCANGNCALPAAPQVAPDSAPPSK